MELFIVIESKNDVYSFISQEPEHYTLFPVYVSDKVNDR